MRATPVIARLALVWFVLVLAAEACIDRPPSTDAGADPSVSDCCLWFVVPLYYDRPQTCLCKHTDEGEERWLTCLGGLADYTCDKRNK